MILWLCRSLVKRGSGMRVSCRDWNQSLNLLLHKCMATRNQTNFMIPGGHFLSAFAVLAPKFSRQVCHHKCFADLLCIGVGESYFGRISDSCALGHLCLEYHNIQTSTSLLCLPSVVSHFWDFFPGYV